MTTTPRPETTEVLLEQFEDPCGSYYVLKHVGGPYVVHEDAPNIAIRFQSPESAHRWADTNGFEVAS